MRAGPKLLRPHCQREDQLAHCSHPTTMEVTRKPHLVCVAYPAQSHIKAMLKLAKLLHSKGFHITFVNTEYNHKRFIKARGPNSLDGLPDFQFKTIPDGLPSSDDANATQDITSLCQSVSTGLLAPFLNLLSHLNDSSSTVASDPPVTCIVSDGFMPFTVTAGEQLGIPVILFWSISACAFMGVYQLRAVREKGLTPLKDESYLTNGYLDTVIDWIPGMKGIQLKDLPSFVRTTNPDDLFFNSCVEATSKATKAFANILQTFDALEQDLLDVLSSMLPLAYAIGPLQLLLDQISEDKILSKAIGYNLWKEESECLEWLESKEPNSVIYVNFGSITVLTKQQLMEFAWGLANSNYYFLWIVRPDLVMGDSAILPPEFVEEIKERGLIASWCPQEEVLNHPSIGGFLTHGGWNSIVESLSSGVPMICWPFIGDQQTNCRYMCKEWEVGVEINNDVKRDEVEKLVKELMRGEKGKKMKEKAVKLKKLAEEASGPSGSSSLNLDKLVTKILQSIGG